MHIFFVKNYKRKITLFFAILMVWVLMFIISSFFIENRLSFNVKIDNYLSFSYPIAYEVDNIYISDHMTNNSIETGFSFKEPVKQQFSSYKTLKGKFSFSYPSAFILNEKEFSGTDILYHIDFHEKSSETHGFVQVWNLTYNLKEFLDSSKEASQLNYKYFKTEEIKVNGMPGYMWDYSVQGSDRKYYKGKEVFLGKNERMYRISFFIPEKNWDKKQSKIFWRMVKSFKTF